MTTPLDLRAALARLQRAALRAADPAEAVYKAASRVGDQLLVGDRAYFLRDFAGVHVVGAGKAAAPMAEAVSEVLRDDLTDGLIITKYGHLDRTLPDRIQVREAGHPVPDESSAASTARLAALLQSTGARDLVIVVLSGGGSALMTRPAAGLSLADLQATTQVLLRAGATIHQINAVRKHLDEIKGGGLARLANGATIVTLILSDVIGDDLSVIASGPTVPDPSTFEDAWRVVEQFNLIDHIPTAVRDHLQRGRRGEIADTPKPGDPMFARVQTVIIGSNAQAAQAAEAEAQRLGFNTLLLSARVQGEAREVARVAAAIAQEIQYADRPVRKPGCVIMGGETTVTVTGRGRGGRNQELALAAAGAIDGLPHTLIASFGTDGTDGPTDAAGAMATGETVGRGRAIGLEAAAYLANNDSYTYFKALGDLIVTGPTGTNVNDVMVVLVGSSNES
jgi:hydroxypyruvate reductase